MTYRRSLICNEYSAESEKLFTEQKVQPGENIPVFSLQERE